MSQTEPWNIRNDNLEDPALIARLSSVIYTLAETLRVCSILLQPYMPDRASEALDRLGVAPERRTYEFAVRGADGEYGQGLKKIESRGSAGSLFPPLLSEEFGEESGEPLVQQREARLPAEARKRRAKEAAEKRRGEKAERREKKRRGMEEGRGLEVEVESKGVKQE